MSVGASVFLSVRANRWLRLLITAFLGLLLAGGLVEIGLRVLDPHGIRYFRDLERYQVEALRPSNAPGLIFEHRPDVVLDLGVEVRINAFGLRGPPIEPAKPPGTSRLLVLGDSIAFGLGVQEEEGVCRLLERTLRDEGAGDWSVLNAGVVGFNTVQELAWFRHRGLDLDPDLVLLLYVSNDVQVAREGVLPGTWDGGDASMPPELEGELSAFEWWVLTNRIDLAWMDLLRYRTLARFLASQAEAPPTEARRKLVQRLTAGARASLDVSGSLAALGELDAVCRDRGIPFVVAVHSGVPGLPAYCDGRGILWFDTGFERHLGDPGYRNSDVDAHPNARGHRWLCDAIEDGLRRLGLPPSTGDERKSGS